MNNTYSQLFQPFILPNGAVLSNRIAMAPMIVFGADEDGSVGEEELVYFEKRSDVAGLIITGAAFINEVAQAVDGQISISKDEDVEGLTTLAKTAKQDGNKVVVQLHHPGREASRSYEKIGRVVAP